MKKLITGFAILLWLQHTHAQQSDKAFTLPKIWGKLTAGSQAPAVSTDGKKLYFGHTIIDPESIFVNIYDRDLEEANSKNGHTNTYCLSPDLRYRVINMFNVQENLGAARAGGLYLKDRDWVSRGASPVDTGWHFQSYEDNYALRRVGVPLAH